MDTYDQRKTDDEVLGRLRMEEAADTRAVCRDDDKHVFSSGASSSGYVPPYHLLTQMFLDRTAIRGDLGVKRHGFRNYEKAKNDKEFALDRLNHAIKHLRQAQENILSNRAFADDDLAAAAFNCLMVMEYEHANGLDSVPF